MRKVLFLITMLAFALTSSVWAADISGTWTVKWKSPPGEEESFDLLIKAAGENLTITGTHPKLETLVGTGTLKDNAIVMNLKSTGSMKVVVDFKGTVSGNKMSGTREIMTAPGSGPNVGPAGGGQTPANAPGAAGAPSSGGQAPAGGQGGAPGGDSGQVSKAWTAEKK